MLSCLRKTFNALDSPDQFYDLIEVRNKAGTHGFDLRHYHHPADFLGCIFDELSEKFADFDTSGPCIRKATVCESCFRGVHLIHVNGWIFLMNHDAVDSKIELLDSFWRFFYDNGCCKLFKTSYTFDKPPPVVICAIENVASAGKVRVKNAIKVTGSITIDVGSTQHCYTVEAIVLHKTFREKNVVSSYGGHFTCCVKSSDGTWFEIDDQQLQSA